MGNRAEDAGSGKWRALHFPGMAKAFLAKEPAGSTLSAV